MAGVTLDSGALIGFERQNRRTLTHIKLAQELGHELTVPTPSSSKPGGAGLVQCESPRSSTPASSSRSPHLARLAGEAIAAVKGATVVDAVVMASAASRGDRVLTSDFEDLDRLRSYFPEVRLLKT